MTTVAVAGRETQRLEADRFAGEMTPLIESIRSGGARTLAAVAAELNRRGIRTARGGAWHAKSVRNILRRVRS
jgi:hypothetical protein